ncbi:cysteine-rich DPF motif domain-containing protein 1 isoform X2 [Gouania willdenowi]|uniref:cysteine-rich DPF motif domain-containing protein 1 isoform X2 n=1 Tax=Gouania willdenowi TaxID=441366 RepID=UPI001054E0C2|nr:cysteine-rich DPF motif domain-containing protein 1 isoform X2 [Gouania willdenowi]
MDQTTNDPPDQMFTCQLCGLSSPFTYYGQKPPKTRAIVLLEDCYVTKDPFSPDKEKFLVLGSTCSLCSTCVCVSPSLLHQEVLHAVCEQALGAVPAPDPD